MFSGSGILLVDKPAGVSSFAVVDKVRLELVRAFPDLVAARGVSRGHRQGSRKSPRPPRFKCGHAGTLDPLATGLLVILIGKGSRLSPFLMGMDKSYSATLRFGAATDSLDRDGEVTATALVPKSVADVVELLPRFRGKIQQVPPLISALKRDGKPLYKRVRDGEDVAEPDAREIEISRLDLTGAHWNLPLDLEQDSQTPGILGADGIVHQMDLVVDCSSGTYIRSLARDLAEAAGSMGHLHRLRRLRVGPYNVQDAISGVMQNDGVELAKSILPLGQGLIHLPGFCLSDRETGLVRNGAQPEGEWLERFDSDIEVGAEVNQNGQKEFLYRMLDPEGNLVAVGRLDPETGQPKLAVVIPVTTEPREQGPCV